MKKAEVAIYVWGLVDSLAKGFTDYLRNPTRVAVLYATEIAGPVFVYDPQLLLEGDRNELEEHMNAIKSGWQSEVIDFRGGKVIPGPQLSNRLTFAFNGRHVPLQVWIVELSDHDLHAEIIRNWVAHAVTSWEFEGKDLVLKTSARSMLRTGARQAVESAIQSHFQEQTGSSLELRLDWIIDLLIGLSRSFEEKKKHSGLIAFQARPQPLAIRLAKPVRITEWKHIGKLLILTDEHFSLVANDQHVVGYVNERPKRDLIATINGGVCSLYVGDQGFGNIDRGFFLATDFLPDLLQIPEFEDTPYLYFTISQIILGARRGHHGASVVADLKKESMFLGGNVLAEPVRKFEPETLLDSMSKVDGAIHVNADGFVIAFGCILDGSRNFDLEKPSRGSRFNSAVRFSFERPDCVIVVVSEDGPISLVRNGRDLLEKPIMPELDRIDIDPPDFEKWLRMGPGAGGIGHGG